MVSLDKAKQIAEQETNSNAYSYIEFPSYYAISCADGSSTCCMVDKRNGACTRKALTPSSLEMAIGFGNL